MAIVQTDESALSNQARRSPAGSAVTGPTDQHRPTTVHQVYVKRPCNAAASILNTTSRSDWALSRKCLFLRMGLTACETTGIFSDGASRPLLRLTVHFGSVPA